MADLGSPRVKLEVSVGYLAFVHRGPAWSVLKEEIFICFNVGPWFDNLEDIKRCRKASGPLKFTNEFSEVTPSHEPHCLSQIPTSESKSGL